MGKVLDEMRLEARESVVGKRLAPFFRCIVQLMSTTIWRLLDGFLDGFLADLEKRLAEKCRNNSSLQRQQDGKTLSLSKKGHIHMCAHTHVHGTGLPKKTVLRLADALVGRPAVSS